MKLRLPFARISRFLFVSLAVCINAGLSAFAAYSVTDIGSWSANPAGDFNGTLAWALAKGEDVQLQNDLVSSTWTSWTRDGSAVRLAPKAIEAGNTLTIDLNQQTLAGIAFSFITGDGTLAIENGTLGSVNNILYFGTSGNANVDITTATVLANKFIVGNASGAHTANINIANSSVSATDVEIAGGANMNLSGGSSIEASNNITFKKGESHVGLDGSSMKAGNQLLVEKGADAGIAMSNGSQIEADSLKLDGGRLDIVSTGANSTIDITNGILVGSDQSGVEKPADRYNSHLSLSGVDVTADSLTVYSNQTDNKVSFDSPEYVGGDVFSLKDGSTMSLGGGDALFSGEGDEMDLSAQTVDGKLLMQQRDAQGNLVFDEDDNPVFVQEMKDGVPVVDDGGNPVYEKVSKSYYYSTGSIVGSSLLGVDKLTVADGFALNLYNDSHIEADEVVVTGVSENGNAATLAGSGRLTWTGDMTIEEGGIADFSQMSINGGDLGALLVGENGSQTVLIAGGIVEDEAFKATRVILDGDIIAKNESLIDVKDAADIRGANNLIVQDDSKVKFSGKLKYASGSSAYEASTLKTGGALSVTDGGILAVTNGWQLDFNGGDDSVIDQSQVYVGVDLDAPEAEQGVGALFGIKTKLLVSGNLQAGVNDAGFTSKALAELDAASLNDGRTIVSINDGATMEVKGDAALGVDRGSIVHFKLNADNVSRGGAEGEEVPSDNKRSRFIVGKDLVVGEAGKVLFQLGRDDGASSKGTKVTTGSTLLAKEAGSQAVVDINAHSSKDHYYGINNPQNYAWKVSGKGQNNLNNMRSEGDASLRVRSGLIFIGDKDGSQGIFSMAGSKEANGDDKILYSKDGFDFISGVATFIGGTDAENAGRTELRVWDGIFKNSNGTDVGRINFEKGAILSGKGEIIAGESMSFSSSVLSPGSRFMYDDGYKDGEEAPEFDFMIGTLVLTIDKQNIAPGENSVTITDGSRISVALSTAEPDPETGVKESSFVSIRGNGGNVKVDSDFIVDLYRVSEGEYKLMEILGGGVFTGDYTGYSLQSEDYNNFTLNGNLFNYDGEFRRNMADSLLSQRILIGAGDITTYFNGGKTELWVGVKETATSGNVTTYWTGDDGTYVVDGQNHYIWSMYHKNWDSETTHTTEQFLDGDRVFFGYGAGSVSQNEQIIHLISHTVSGTEPKIAVAEMNVIGDKDWTFVSEKEGVGIYAYNSHLYSSLEPEVILGTDGQPVLDPDGKPKTLDLRTGQLNKIGSGTLTLSTKNEFFGGIYLGGIHPDGTSGLTTGGKVILDNLKGFGSYDISEVARGADKGTVIVNSDAKLETTGKIKGHTVDSSGKITEKGDYLQNRFLIEKDGNLDIKSDSGYFLVGNDLNYGYGSSEQGKHGTHSQKGGAFYIEGVVTTDAHVEVISSMGYDGAGMYLTGAGSISAKSLTFTGNFAARGITRNEDEDDNFDSISPVHRGGAIYANLTSDLTLKNLVFEDNRAYGMGGAVYLDKGNLTFTVDTATQHPAYKGKGLIVKDNKSVKEGGGMFINDHGELTLDLSNGDILFTGNQSGVDFKDPDGGSFSMNPRVLASEASNNAIHLGYTGDGASDLVGGTLNVIGANHAYFYDPITGTKGSTVNIGGSVKSVFRGFSQYAGDTTIGYDDGSSTAEFRLEQGSSKLSGIGFNDLAGYGVTGMIDGKKKVDDYTEWTAMGGKFTLNQNATLTGSGYLGGTEISLKGIIRLDDGRQYDAGTPGSVDSTTLGTLHIFGNTTISETANWYVTLQHGDANPGYNVDRLSDQMEVFGDVKFTGTIPDERFRIEVDDLVRGRYTLVTTTDGITNFNTDKKLSGTPVWWKAPNDNVLVNLAKTGLTNSDHDYLGRARAVTYAEGKNLYLNVTARNRHVEGNAGGGVWSDDNKWVFDAGLGLPTGGILTNDWHEIDKGPATSLFLNGDMVTFNPGAGQTQTFEIKGEVRPVDMFVTGLANSEVIFEGTGGIKTFTLDLTSKAENGAEYTSIRPEGWTGDTYGNDYEIPFFTGKLYKTTGNTLTFTNGSSNLFTEGIQIGGSYEENKGVTNNGADGGTIQFSTGNQLLVGSNKEIHFIGDGILRNTATTILAPTINIDVTKTARFDVGADSLANPLTLTKSTGIIKGAGAIRKTGEGKFILNTANTFTGGATFGLVAGDNAGTVSIGSQYNALGANYTGIDKVGVVDVIGNTVLTKETNSKYLTNFFNVRTSGSLTINVPSTTLSLRNVDRSAFGNQGGAIFVASGASAQLSTNGNGTFSMTGNKSWDGGAIYTAHVGELVFGTTTSTFQSNQAAGGSGGAIWSAGDVTFDGTNLTLSTNTASVSGGAIYVKSGDVNISGKNITSKGNEAGGMSGGAIYVKSGDVNISGENITFEGNNAVMHGGAIYAENIEIENAGSVKSVFTGNTATMGGGALYLSDAVSTLTLKAGGGDIEFKSNAALKGEAVYITGGTINIEGNKNVLFYDTIESKQDTNVIKNGTGTLFFGFETGETNGSNILATTTVNAGMLRVVDSVRYGSTANTGQFLLTQGASLTGGGTIGAGNAFLRGDVSADTSAAVGPVLEADKKIGVLTFTNNVSLQGANLKIDIQSSESTDPLFPQGLADKLVVGGQFDIQKVTGNPSILEMSTFNFYNFGEGEYLLVDSGAQVQDTATINNLINIQVHGFDITDRHQIDIVRGDDVRLVSTSDDTQVWAKMNINNLYMYWNGDKNSTWNPYDTDSLDNENWVNENVASANTQREGHIINADAVYFGDTKYDYTTGTSAGGAGISRRSITVNTGGVVVTDMVVNNSDGDYSFSVGKISTTDSYGGSILANKFTGGIAPEGLTKQGTRKLTFTNSANEFGGNLLMQGGEIVFSGSGYNSFGGSFLMENGTVRLNNTGVAGNTFTGGIIFQGGVLSDNVKRDIYFTTSAQLGSNDIVFNEGGTLHALYTSASKAITLSNNISISNNKTGTLNLNVDSTPGKLVSLNGGELTGSGTFEQIGAAATLQIRSDQTSFAGYTKINGGTFRVVDGINYGGFGTLGFTQAERSSTLAGGGTITAKEIVINGAISPDKATLASHNAAITGDARYGTLSFNAGTGGISFNDFQFSYDMGTGHDSRTGSTPTGDLISINSTGSIAFTGDNVLDIQSGTLERGKHYLIIDANKDLGLTSANDAFKGGVISSTQEYLTPRVGTAFKFGSSSATELNDESVKSQIWLSAYHNSLNMVWKNTAANSQWDQASGNWLSKQSNSAGKEIAYERVFQNGDYVHFDSTSPAGTVTQNVDVIVSGLDVNSSGSYTFAGTGGIHGKYSDASIVGDYVNVSLIPDGMLTKDGSGTLTVNNGENTFDGGILVKNGTVSFQNAKNTFNAKNATDYAIELAGGTVEINKAAQLTDARGNGILFSGDATLKSTATLTLGHQVTIDTGKTATLDAAGSVEMTMSGKLTGAGALAKTSTGTVILTGGTSDYTGGSTVEAGVLEIRGAALSAGQSGKDVSIASGATFKIGTHTGAFALANTIRNKASGNTGTLLVDNGAGFAFGMTTVDASAQGAGFSGVVEMHNTTYSFNAITSAFFGGEANLTTKAGSVATVTDKSSSGAESFRGWNMKKSTVTFDGGSVTWNYDNHNDAKGIIDAGNLVAGSNKTTLKLNISDTFVSNPSEGSTLYPSGSSLFAAQQATNTNPSLLLATSVADISALATSQLDVELWKSGVKATGTSVSQQVDQGAGAIADGIFDWNAIVTAGEHTLSVGFGLVRVDIYDNQTLNVFRNAGDGGILNVVLTDKNLGGKGNVLISNNGNASNEITLNASNSYTGTTTVSGGTTLITGITGALGSATAHTSELIINAAGARAQLNGTSQIVGKLTVGSNGVLDFQSGSTLSIDNGGTVFGTGALISTGTDVSTINVNGGNLAVSGANTSLLSNVNVASGATVTLDNVGGIGTTQNVTVANGGQLVLNGATGTFSKNISGGGTVHVNSSCNVVLSGNNSGCDSISSLFDIKSGSILTASEAKHIGQADVAVAGQFIANNSANWALSANNNISGTGELIKQNTGTLSIGHANTGFTGKTTITGGKLTLSANNAIGTGAASTNTVLVDANGILELAQGVTGFANNISGTGQTLVSGTGVSITGNNTDFTTVGNWEITGTAFMTSQQNLGGASVNIKGTSAQLTMTTTGDFDFVNVLTGTGKLTIDLGDSDSEFTFNTSAGTNFNGTLQLKDSYFELGEAGQALTNTNAMSNAMLQVSSGAIVNVTGDYANRETFEASSTIGGLTFDGGRVVFDVSLPPDAFSAGVVDASDQGIYITSNTGEVGISSDLSDALQAAFDNPTDPSHERNILDQDNAGDDAIKLAIGEIKEGSANSLGLVDANGNLISDATLVNINEGGELAAIGKYDYSLAAGTGNQDLYVDYTLVELDLQLTDDDKALTLSNADSNDNTLSAKLTGVGNIAIEANDDEIIFSNSDNDYTGKTIVKNGTLVSGADNALGQEDSHTSELIIFGNAAYDLDGYEQHIGQLTNAGTVTLGDGTLTTHGEILSEGLIDLQEGILHVLAGGTISGNGALAGTADSTLIVGDTIIDPDTEMVTDEIASHLVINGANTGFQGDTLVTGRSSITLDHAYGLGSSVIELEGAYDVLDFQITNAANAGASQAFSGTIKGEGELRVTAEEIGGELYITSANEDFHGETFVDKGVLVVTDVDGVGDSMIRVMSEGEGSIFRWLGVKGEDDSAAMIVNDMSGLGTIEFDQSHVAIESANTAKNFSLVNGSTVELEHAQGLGTRESFVNVDASSHLELGVSGVQLGHVDNYGLISFREPGANNMFRATGPTQFKTASMTSLSGNGSLLFNVDIPNTTADHLTIYESVTGSHMVLVNWQSWGMPDSGNRSIPLIHTQNFISSSDAFKLPVNMAGKEAIDVGSFAFTLRQGNGTEITPDRNEWYLVGDSLSKSAEAIVATSAGLALAWHLEMDTLLKRMGDIRLSQYSGYDRSKHNKLETWVRTYGMELNVDEEVTGSAYREYYYGGDLGIDKYYRVEEGKYRGHLYTGLFAGMGNTHRTFNGFGRGDTDLFRTGMYTTYLSDNGWYMDLVGKFNHYDHKFDSISTYGDKNHGSYNQKGMGFSFELGKQYVDKSDNTFIEPQMQVSYGRIGGKNYITTGDVPVDVRVQTLNTWQFRSGFRAGKNYALKTTALTPYVKGSFAHMWNGGGRITTSDGMTHKGTLDGSRFEIGAGVIWDRRKNGQYYADYEYIQGKNFHIPWRVNLGYRVQF